MIMLRFVTTAGNAVSEGIRKYEYGYWATHVEALMPDGTLLGAHADGGVMARGHDYDKDQFTRELYVSIVATPEQVDSFHSFVRSQIGKPYDFEAIAALAASPVLGERDWRSQDAWMCSELQASALCHCGIFPPRLATEFCHVTPRDLLLIISGRIGITQTA